MKGEWIILLWVLLGVVFLVKTAPVGDLVRRVRRQSPVIQAAVAFCLFVAVIILLVRRMGRAKAQGRAAGKVSVGVTYEWPAKTVKRIAGVVGARYEPSIVRRSGTPGWR